MRNATVYGVSPRLRLDIVLNNLAAWSHTTGRIRLLSDGTAWRPLIHVRDVAKAALALLAAPTEAVRGAGLQRRLRCPELPCPRPGRAALRADRLRGRVRRGLERRLALLPGRLLASSVGPSRSSALDWDARGAAPPSSSAPIAANGLTQEEFEGDRYVRLRRLRSPDRRAASSTRRCTGALASSPDGCLNLGSGRRPLPPPRRWTGRLGTSYHPNEASSPPYPTA